VEHVLEQILLRERSQAKLAIQLSTIVWQRRGRASSCVVDVEIKLIVRFVVVVRGLKRL
jgi:hypothetical protein